MEKPLSWHGAWGIGCSICCQANLKSKHAQFESNTIDALQLCNLKLHSSRARHKSAAHKIAHPIEEAHASADLDPRLPLGNAEWALDVPGAPSGSTFAHAMVAFHECASAQSGDAGYHAFFGTDVDVEKRKVATAWACLAEVIDAEARERLKVCDDASLQADGRKGDLLDSARSNPD